MTEDVLSWEKFYKNSEERGSYPPKEIELYNRLVAHTKNFFAIGAIGAFSQGYLMIVTKKLLPSFALVDDSLFSEMNWFIKSISGVLEETYNRKVVVFEHGMCSCVGGLDRAHLHLMTADNKANDKVFLDSINKILKKRKAGIEYVEYQGYKLENIHDINQIMDSKKNLSYKIGGKQLSHKDIKNDLNLSKWPTSAHKHVKQGGHYVYFNNNSSASSFLTGKNFETKLGREILFDIEIKTNDKLKNFYNEATRKNSYCNVWKWQEFPFNENILKTMTEINPGLLKLKNLPGVKSYDFESF